MRLKGMLGVVGMLLVAASGAVLADAAGVLEVKGIGLRGKDYPIGRVEFLDVALADQLVHWQGGTEIPLRLRIGYKVLRSAPVLLNSRFGTEYWRLYHHDRHTVSALHTREQIDLSKEGVYEAKVDKATASNGEHVPLSKGLVSISGHYYFLIDQADGNWLDVVREPVFFSQPEVTDKLIFTLANLSSFTLSFSEIQSTWEPGGPLRAKLTVTDADGDVLPVANVAARVSDGDWEVALVTQKTWQGTLRRWLSGKLPEGRVPEQITVKATVSAMTPDGPVQQEVTRAVRRGEGRATLAEMGNVRPAWKPPRNENGKIRETRALWVDMAQAKTREDIRELVQRAADMGLNTLLVDIFYHSRLLAKSSLAKMPEGVEEGLDPLAELCRVAHERGLELHPWFCVSYASRDFGPTHPNMGVVDEDGNFVRFVADLHSPEYRDYFVEVVLEVARNYDINGIHLDYIRIKANCHCERCRKGFEEQFGKPITEATYDDWVAWNRPVVGDIVRRVAEGVRAIKPEAIVSAAVFAGLRAGAHCGQDPAEWARQNWVHVVMPMDYDLATLDVHASERQFLDILDEDGKLVTGLSLYQRSATGSGARPRSPELVEEQIQLVRAMGIRGYCLFAYAHLSPEIAEMLKTEINQEPAVPYFR